MISYPRFPKEIQDKIAMYNYAHKPQMKVVLREMMYVWFPKKSVDYWKDQHSIIMMYLIKASYCNYCEGPKMFVYFINMKYCSFKLYSPDGCPGAPEGRRRARGLTL
jgi:hypothetical protein